MCGESGGLDILTHRRSCRKFWPSAISRDVIETIVNAGRLAATARNLQPWHFVAVTDAEKRQKIASITDYGKFIAEAPVCIVVLCDDTRYYLEDGSAATQNLLNAAEAMGLGSCWVAGDKKNYAPHILALIDAPKEMKLISLVAIGHADHQGPRPPKKTLSQVLRWDHF